MKISYGLAATLFFFQGIIIQSDGAEINKQILPDEIIGEIIAKTGFQKTKELAQAEMNVAEIAMKRIFETYIIDIVVLWDHMTIVQPPVEVVHRGEKYLQIRSYAKLMSLFEQFGSHARKIHICYSLMDKQRRREINEKIINKNAKRLTELKISGQDDTGIWEEMANDQGDIRFPNVENFIYYGIMQRKHFDLNAIFPKLKSFTLMGSVADTNFLANVKNLKELKLSITSIPDHQLGIIFKNNQQITTLTLTTDSGKKIKRESLRLVENMRNLKTLMFNNVSPDFFNRASDRVYNLTSVISFKATFNALIVADGNFSIEMPNLKHLELQGAQIDNHTSDLINHFKTLESVRLNREHYFNLIDCIEQLKYVKEFATSIFKKSEFPSLKNFFEKFDIRKSNLNKLTFYVGDSDYSFYRTEMDAINNKLRKSNKPTWTPSCILIDSEHCIMFMRDTSI